MTTSSSTVNAAAAGLDKSKRRICVLPVAGKEDPTQMLMMQAVDQGGCFELRHGVQTRFFAATRTCLKYHPDFLYFDWISRYCVGRTRLVTLVKLVAFWLDVQIVTKIFRRPIVWSLHNLQSHEQSANSRWEMPMQRYFARHCQIIRVFSDAAVDRAQHQLGVNRSKLRVLPVGNYIDYYPNQISMADARLKLGLAQGDFVLLWLGSIRPYKGLHELVEAFRRVAQPHWRLVIAGKPFVKSYAKEIEALAQTDSRIQFHGRFIGEEELQVYYNAANVVTLPFVEVENTSSLVVAMGFRKPVLAPNLGVIGERLCHQPELVYEAGGLEGALQKLSELSLERIAKIGELNSAEICRYSWCDMAKIFAELSGEHLPAM